MPDKDSYPTPLEILKIQTWNPDDPFGLIGYVFGKWTWKDYCKIKSLEPICFELHTGGWSGNEQIIEAMKINPFWEKYLVKEKRGGHYYFSEPLKEH